MYDYRVIEILRVIDGDTVDCIIDLGFGLRASFRFRLLDVDTPERGEPDWERATNVTRAWLEEHIGEPLAVRTHKSGGITTGIGDGAFGRWMGDIYSANSRLSDVLIEEGWGTDAGI